MSEIDVRASACPGECNDEFEQTKQIWLFADPLIRHEFRARPDDLRMITVDGDSMEPLLSNGDRILIDVSQRVPVPPDIFVIWDGTGLVTKWIEHMPHSEPPKVVIKSLNPEYTSYEGTAEQIRVVGRAVWVARRLWNTWRHNGDRNSVDSRTSGIVRISSISCLMCRFFFPWYNTEHRHVGIAMLISHTRMCVQWAH